MKTERIGFTLGKFAPLHAGHQLVLETALAEMDRVLAVVYDCQDQVSIPMPIRAAWIRELFPSVEVIEAWDGPGVVGDTPEIVRMHDAYLGRLMEGRGVTHFYSSEFYGDHVSRGLGVVDRRVDPERRERPISATRIREDPYRHRDFMHPRVYRDLIVNVAILGAPSTGKTTLAERLAGEHGTVWMPEYGREYWQTHQVDRRLTPAQLVEIAEGHLEREEAMLARANRYLFTDTNALTTMTFALDYHGRAERRVVELAEKTGSRYDLTFVCGDDIPFDDTWDRSGETQRWVFQRRTLSELARLKTPYWVLEGGVEARVAKANAILRKFRKFGNPAEAFGVGLE
jgi:NadR type nicotinamide-nucleotide adenylyltransferase